MSSKTDMKKGILIGPLDDGKVYKYDLQGDIWFDDEGEVDFLPYRCTSTNGRIETFYFHTKTHKWLDEYFMVLPINNSVIIDYNFRRKYGLNGKVKLFTLEEKRRGRSEPEEMEDNPEDNPPESPLLPWKCGFNEEDNGYNAESF